MMQRAIWLLGCISCCCFKPVFSSNLSRLETRNQLVVNTYGVMIICLLWYDLCWLYVIVSRFILFVVTPDWLADRLRDDIVPGILCLMIAILLILTEICGNGGLEICQCNCHCFGYWFGMACLFFFTILYLAT